MGPPPQGWGAPNPLRKASRSASRETAGVPEPTIYVMRHGETVGNVAGRLQGSRYDSPLTALGRAQARACADVLASLLAGQPAPQFVASPVGRARQTMEIVLGRLRRDPMAYLTDPLTAELDFGAWSGLTRPDAKRRDPDRWQARQADKWNVAPPGGEAYDDVARRARSWLATVGQDTVLVSHGGFSRVLRGVYLGQSPAAMLALPEPHDSLFRLRGAMVQEFAATGIRTGQSDDPPATKNV